jgi:tRNA (guanine37-N1)-methyltransferase
MRFEIVTIFPGFFSGFLENGILRRALAEGLVEIGVHDLRAYTHDRHRTVDDRPFGGGEGMVLKPQPIADALAALGIELKTPAGAKAQFPFEPVSARLKSCPVTESFIAATSPCESVGSLNDFAATSGNGSPDIEGASRVARPTVILLSAQGRPFTQAIARRIAALDRVVLLCGRYEGVDERINELYCDFELSIGDYVLSGGELAAAVVIDAAMRLIPGVLGNEASSEFESFGAADAAITTDAEGVPRSQHGSGGLLDYPHYTRPAEFGGLKVPEPLVNGDHQAIRRWRREQQLRKTLANRPDLLENAVLSKEDRKLLDAIRKIQPACIDTEWSKS